MIIQPKTRQQRVDGLKTKIDVRCHELKLRGVEFLSLSEFIDFKASELSVEPRELAKNGETISSQYGLYLLDIAKQQNSNEMDVLVTGSQSNSELSHLKMQIRYLWVALGLSWMLTVIGATATLFR